MKFLKYFLGVILLLVLLLFITGNGYVFKGIQLVYLKGRTTANIYDAKDFENNPIPTSDNYQPLAKDSSYGKIPLSDKLVKELVDFKTSAFLVLKHGNIVQEQYWEGDSLTRSNSFSMAKSLTTLLVQKAIEDGYIQSWDQPFTDFVEEYKKDKWGRLCTLADLSRMTSGFDWNEDYYLPLNPTAKAYYGTNMDKVILNRKFINPPNKAFIYLSGNTQLLGYALQRSLKGKTIATYLSEKFWQPMGMNDNALWTVDHKGGIEKTYCCVHSNARNFSKFGLLLMNDGKWKGKSLIDSSFIQKMKKPYALSHGQYGYGIWTEESYKHPFYMFRGHLGQYIICIPEEDIVIVRLGELRDNRPHSYSDGKYPLEVYVYVEETLQSLKDLP